MIRTALHRASRPLARLTKAALARGLISAVIAACAVQSANAQTFSTTTTGAIDGSIDCAGATRLTRTINVPTAFTVDKVNLGFFATHTWRGDIELTLSPPDGAPVIQLINSDTNNLDEDNYNVELDNFVLPVINTGTHTTNDGTDIPPAVAAYENLVRPNNVSNVATDGLGAFTGEAAQGNWTLSICDAFPGADDGQFEAATLYFINASEADLSLTASSSTATPDYGTTVNLSFTLTNSGPATATGNTVQVNLPSGLAYSSHTGAGSYNSATGLWTPPDLTAGSNTTVTVTATVLTSGGYTTTAEVAGTALADPDSTPGNNSTSEDDDTSVSLSPIYSTPPALSCPVVDQFSHIWTAPGGAQGWDAGDLTNSYTSGGQALDFTISGSTDNLIARNGTTTPATTNEFTGGGTATYGLTLYVDFDSTADEIIVDLTLGTPGIGVGDVQFSVWDVDLGTWTDRIVVSGSLGGVSKNPLLTPSTGNTVSGNALVGTGGSSATQGNGNSTITFNSSVDRVTLSYSNANPAANPSAQIISIMPFTMCPPVFADLTANKTVEMYDPSGTGATDIYAIPGNEVLYKIQVTNAATASAVATDINLSDVLPDSLRFINATVTGFTGGSFTAPALPAANTDCAGGACIINYTGASLGINTTGEIAIRAVVK